MKKNALKTLALLLAAVLVLGSFAGCGEAAQEPSAPPESGAPASDAARDPGGTRHHHLLAHVQRQRGGTAARRGAPALERAAPRDHGRGPCARTAASTMR